MGGILEQLAVGAAMFVFVFLKAFQQRNVAFEHYWEMLPTSYAMAFVEVYVIASIATAGYSFALVNAIGLGGAAGAISATYLHKKWMRK